MTNMGQRSKRPIKLPMLLMKWNYQDQTLSNLESLLLGCVSTDQPMKSVMKRKIFLRSYTGAKRNLHFFLFRNSILIKLGVKWK